MIINICKILDNFIEVLYKKKIFNIKLYLYLDLYNNFFRIKKPLLLMF